MIAPNNVKMGVRIRTIDCSAEGRQAPWIGKRLTLNFRDYLQIPLSHIIELNVWERFLNPHSCLFRFNEGKGEIDTINAEERPSLPVHHISMLELLGQLTTIFLCNWRLACERRYHSYSVHIALFFRNFATVVVTYVRLLTIRFNELHISQLE